MLDNTTSKMINPEPQIDKLTIYGKSTSTLCLRVWMEGLRVPVSIRARGSRNPSTHLLRHKVKLLSIELPYLPLIANNPAKTWLQKCPRMSQEVRKSPTEKENFLSIVKPLFLDQMLQLIWHIIALLSLFLNRYRSPRCCRN